MNITRRKFLASVPPALVGGTAAHAANSPVSAEVSVETPMQKVSRLRQELISATMEAYPEVEDWVVVNKPDDDASSIVVGPFMVIGHRGRQE